MREDELRGKMSWAKWTKPTERRYNTPTYNTLVTSRVLLSRGLAGFSRFPKPPRYYSILRSIITQVNECNEWMRHTLVMFEHCHSRTPQNGHKFNYRTLLQIWKKWSFLWIFQHWSASSTPTKTDFRPVAKSIIEMCVVCRTRASTQAINRITSFRFVQLDAVSERFASTSLQQSFFSLFKRIHPRKIFASSFSSL